MMGIAAGLSLHDLNSLSYRDIFYAYVARQRAQYDVITHLESFLMSLSPYCKEISPPNKLNPFRPIKLAPTTTEEVKEGLDALTEALRFNSGK